MRSITKLCIGAALALLAGATRADSAETAQISSTDIDSILFTDDAIYLGTRGLIPAEATTTPPLPGQPIGAHKDIYFRMDRKGGPLVRVATVPTEAQGMPVSSLTLTGMKGPGSSDTTATYLTTSDADIYQTPGFACPQPPSSVELLTLDCKPVQVPLAATDYVTAVENFGDYLLVGTVRRTNYNAGGPGEGMLVLSRQDHRRVRSIGQDDGLAENMIKLIRRDPKTGGVWVETPRSLAELSPKLDVQTVLYLHIGFDADAIPALLASDTPQYDDPYALLALNLHVTDYAAFAKAVAGIPGEFRTQLNSIFPPGYGAFGKIPKALDGLYPFFAADLVRNPDPRQASFALRGLCKFGDPRAKDVADRLITTTGGTMGRNLWYAVKDCADPAVAEAHRPPPLPTSGAYVIDAQGNAVPLGTARAKALMTPPTIKPGYMMMLTAFSPPFFYWDGSRRLHLEDTTENYGGGTAGASLTRYYLSSTLPVDLATARVIAERRVPALAVGQTDTHGVDVMPPPDLPHGLYYLAACANADHALPQAYEDDRCRVPTLYQAPGH